MAGGLIYLIYCFTPPATFSNHCIFVDLRYLFHATRKSSSFSSFGALKDKSIIYYCIYANCDKLEVQKDTKKEGEIIFFHHKMKLGRGYFADFHYRMKFGRLSSQDETRPIFIAG